MDNPAMSLMGPEETSRRVAWTAGGHVHRSPDESGTFLLRRIPYLPFVVPSGTIRNALHFSYVGDQADVPKEALTMIGKVTLISALLVSGMAFAQQQPGGSQQQPPAQNPSATQCWDTATNQVRNKMAQSGQPAQPGQPGSTVGAGNTAQGNQSSGASPATRPAGMANC